MCMLYVRTEGDGQELHANVTDRTSSCLGLISHISGLKPLKK